jgi:hypothetical protein
MLGGLSLLPSLAVAGVTTSVSLATAMGGVQSLPQEPARPPVVRMAVAPAEPVQAAPTAAPAGAPTAAPPEVLATPAPTAAPTAAPAVAAAAPHAPAAAKPQPAATPPPAAAPKPAPSTQCTIWPYQGWTVTWCAPTTAGGSSTWTATNGTTAYSGTYDAATGAYTGTYPSGWSSSWGDTGSKPPHGHH